MTAFYFRQDDRSLFGFYHAPGGGPARDAAVVLCQPLGHEYIRCHRAIRILGDSLARAGFPVLRFDYYGCGDSAGDFPDGDLEQWREDVAAAVRHCRALSGRERIAAVGLRLGASLALQAAGAGTALDALVLWNPIVDGAAYLREIERLHAERQPFAVALSGDARRAGEPGELVGFSYARRLLDQLRALDLDRTATAGIARVLLLEMAGAGDDRAAPAPMIALAGPVDRARVSGPPIWRERSSQELDGALVPRLALEAIAGWLDAAYPGAGRRARP
jgi:exosortase A-associated hydrolase 2